MRPHISISRSEFVRQYVNSLLQSSSFDRKTNRTISERIMSGTPSQLSRVGRAFDQALVLGVASRSLNESLQQLGIPLIGAPVGEQRSYHHLNPHDVRFYRQLLLFAKKMPGPTEKSDDEVMSAFVNRVSRSGRPKNVELCDRELCARLLGEPPPIESLIGRHGPGAVRERETGRDKYRWTEAPPRGDYQSLFYCHDVHELEAGDRLRRLTRTARATVVPKDFRGGRVIAIEAKEAQFIGQAYKAWLYTKLPLHTHREIEFEDQAYHRRLMSSLEYATLDLSDASDMVSMRLLRRLVPPLWLKILEDLRPMYIVASGTLFRSRAAFTMGNPLCFPIEALVHYIAVRRVVPAYYPVSVYGDDIIVPKKYTYAVQEALRDFGLLPNPAKCCHNSPFRESCGLDLYDGLDVTPAYLRLQPSGITNQLEALQIVSHQRHLWSAGFAPCSDWMAEVISRFVPLPSVPDTRDSSWALGGSPDLGKLKRRTTTSRSDTPNYQRLEFRLPYLCETKTVALRNWNALLQWFSTGNASVSERRAVPRLRYAWTALDAPSSDWLPT